MFKRTYQKTLYLILVTQFVLTSSTAFAKYTQAPPPAPYDYEVVRRFHKEMRTFSCAQGKKIISEIKATPDQDFEKQIRSELALVKRTLKTRRNDLRYGEKRILRQQRRILKRLLKRKNKKTEVIEFYDKLCRGTEKTWSGVARGSAHFASVVNLIATFPIRFIFNFFRGLIDGKRSPYPRHSLYQVLGYEINRSVGFFSFFQAVRFLSAPTLWLLPFIVSPLVDVFAAQVCETPSPYKPKEQKFCRRYHRVKDVFFKGARSSEVVGVWIHRLFRGKKKFEDEEGSGLTPEEMSQLVIDAQFKDETFCEQFEEIREKVHLSKKQKRDYRREAYKTAINPAQFALPERVDVYAEPNLLRRLPVPQRALRNVVIAFGPKEELQRIYSLSNDRKRFRKLTRRHKKLGRKFKRIFQSKDQKQCQRRFNRLKGSWAEFLAIGERLNEMQVAKEMFNQKLLIKQTNVASSVINLEQTLRLKWEIIPTNHINEVKRILKEPDVGNVILAQHGMPNGKLTDSDMNGIPASFFSEISPSIQSLAFFSCYSQETIEIYELPRKLQESPTYHPLRHLWFLRESSLPSGGTRAPLRSWVGYLRQLDRYLARTYRGNYLYQSLKGEGLPSFQPSPSCHVELRDLDIEAGSLALTLNHQFIHAFEHDFTKKIVPFPCRYLDDEEENQISLYSLNKIEQVKFDTEKLKIKVLHPSESLIHSELEHSFWKKFYEGGTMKIQFGR